MSEIPPTATETTSDDRLWGLLSYLIPIIIPVIVLLMEDKKNRPFIRTHAIQALALGIVMIVVYTILALIPVIGWVITCILGIGYYIMMIVYGMKAYRGESVTIPVVTDFVKRQGWA